MKSLIKISMIAGFCVAMSGCAALGGKKVVKAPCGPTAGMTDPCGNRTPINTKAQDTALQEGVQVTQSIEDA